MAHLRPEFVFRHGGEKGTKTGAKLTLWGHTVVIDPSANSIAEAKVAACRHALELIQESNPEWLVPPQPIDGPTTPDWNWIWMLVDYCEERGWPHPLYRPSSNGNLWHCDISVKDKLFRTVRECGGLGEAQNTAAHTAIYQLMVIESDDGISDPFPTLPSSVTATATATATGNVSVSAPVSTSIQKQCAQILRSGKLQPKRAARPAQYAGVVKAVPPSMMSKRARKKLNRQMELEDQLSLNRLPPSPPPVVARASNMIPLMNSRLAPMGETCKQMEKEDPLAKLRSIEKELKLLSARASFRRVMEKICDVIGSNYPTIVRQKKPGKYPHVYEMLAKFDNSHPYLSRASPIKLADVENPDSEIAEEIAVKHVILHLLKMSKEDAKISEKRYKNELGALRDIEGETKTCLDRQSRPSGVLSY